MSQTFFFLGGKLFCHAWLIKVNTQLRCIKPFQDGPKKLMIIFQLLRRLIFSYSCSVKTLNFTYLVFKHCVMYKYHQIV